MIIIAQKSKLLMISIFRVKARDGARNKVRKFFHV